MEGFRACFADLVDPRRGNAQRHELDEVVMVALLAMVSGAETCVDMALFGRSKEALLRRFLRLPGGIPSHDTFSRVFRLLDPLALEACFARYVAALAERIEGVVAVDGKTMRRSFDRRKGQGPLHLISAFACDTRLALGQRKVDGKSNEITALPELLALLMLDGCMPRGAGSPRPRTTSRPMRCTVKKPRQKRSWRAAATTCWPSRATRRRSSRTSACCSTSPMPCPTRRRRRSTAITAASRPAAPRSSTTSPGSPRSTALPGSPPWARARRRGPGLAAMGKVEATREIDGRATTASRYYILSKPLPADRFLDVVRAHWHVENRLHWVLDVVMDEDQARARKDHAPENLARLRRFALNILRANQDKGSTRGKIKRAAWDDAFLLKLLAAA